MSNPEQGIITSIKNPQVQHLRDLLSRREARREEHAFVVEGVRLAEEVLASGIQPANVLWSSEISPRGKQCVERALALGCEGVELSPDLLNRISETETSQGIFFIVRHRPASLPVQPDLVLILDQVRDPGNAGTILRSAAAAGVKVVFVTPGTVDLFSPKVVRSAMGAHFKLMIEEAEWVNIQAYCKLTVNPALPVFLADSGGGSSMWQTDLRQPLALVIGGEADGAGREAQAGVDALVHIPMPGNFESLNAGVAASVLLFEILRQRSV